MSTRVCLIQYFARTILVRMEFWRSTVISSSICDDAAGQSAEFLSTWINSENSNRTVRNGCFLPQGCSLVLESWPEQSINTLQRLRDTVCLRNEIKADGFA